LRRCPEREGAQQGAGLGCQSPVIASPGPPTAAVSNRTLNRSCGTAALGCRLVTNTLGRQARAPVLHVLRRKRGVGRAGAQLLGRGITVDKHPIGRPESRRKDTGRICLTSVCGYVILSLRCLNGIFSFSGQACRYRCAMCLRSPRRFTQGELSCRPLINWFETAAPRW
jgi:hypothetical protein